MLQNMDSQCGLTRAWTGPRPAGFFKTVSRGRHRKQALADAVVEHEIEVYDDAPHSFFDRKQDEFADASEDAWRRVLAFIDAHSHGGDRR